MRRFLIMFAGSLIAVALVVLFFTIVIAPPLGPLPPPAVACSAPTSWHGIVPGHSTVVDVIQTLGRPADVNYEAYAAGWVPYLAYSVEEGGLVSRFSSDRVFIRPDGVVAWIEVTRADRDGRFHAAEEVVSRLGKTLDVIYVNNNYHPANRWQYDVLGYEDQLYVWSECGMALDVHGVCSAGPSGALECLPAEQLTYPITPLASDLTFRYPNPIPSLQVIQATSDNAVLMEFLFPPTTYQGFTDYYKYMIPWGQWTQYLRELRAK